MPRQLYCQLFCSPFSSHPACMSWNSATQQPHVMAMEVVALHHAHLVMTVCMPGSCIPLVLTDTWGRSVTSKGEPLSEFYPLNCVHGVCSPLCVHVLLSNTKVHARVCCYAASATCCLCALSSHKPGPSLCCHHSTKGMVNVEEYK